MFVRVFGKDLQRQIPHAVAAEMTCDDIEAWKILKDLTELYGRGGGFGWQCGAADMEENNEAPFTGLINGQQGRIVHREALKVRVEFKTPYAVLFETIELFLPVFIAGVQRAEGNGPVSLVLVDFDGVIVGGENLGGAVAAQRTAK